MASLLETERRHYRLHPDAARQLVAEDPKSASGDALAEELAAWTVVANVLLNLDETITKG